MPALLLVVMATIWIEQEKNASHVTLPVLPVMMILLTVLLQKPERLSSKVNSSINALKAWYLLL